MRRSLVAAALGIALVAGCGADQDPGLDPGTSGPSTTSHALQPCPSGGPDATTPAAGCLGEDGKVLRP